MLGELALILGSCGATIAGFVKVVDVTEEHKRKKIERIEHEKKLMEDSKKRYHVMENETYMEYLDRINKEKLRKAHHEAHTKREGESYLEYLERIKDMNRENIGLD